MPMPNHKEQFDFDKIEELRKSMLLTIANMSMLLGVSRMTYYAWRNGSRKIRKQNVASIYRVLKILFTVMEGGWPYPEVVAAEQSKRWEFLLAKLDELGVDIKPLRD